MIEFQGRFRRPHVVAVLLILWVGGAFCSTSPAHGQGDPLTPSERAWLAEHPVIRLAPTADYHPIESIDEDGVYRGITADVFALIEERLGITLEVVNPPLADRILGDPDVMGVDVISLSAPTLKRLENWQFTDPYLELPAVLIVRTGAPDVTMRDLRGECIAVVRGYAAQAWLQSEHPDIKLVTVPDTVTGLRMVSFGLVEAMISDVPVATDAMERDGISNLRLAGESGYVYRMGISTRRDWPELNAIMTKGLALVTPEEHQAIYRRWMTWSELPGSWRMSRVAIGAILGTLLLVGIFVIRNRILARRVRRRSEELARQLHERERAEHALTLSEMRFHDAFEQAHIGIALCGLDGMFLRVNQSLADMLGYTQDELQSMRFTDITHPDDLAVSMEHLDNAVGGKTNNVQFDKRYLRRDGTIVWVLLSSVLHHDQEGNPGYFLSQMIDISARKQSEEALKKMTATQRRLLNELDHRVKNNLAGLLALIDLRTSDDLTDFRTRLRDRVVAMNLVHDLIAHSKHRTADLSTMLSDLAQCFVLPDVQTALTANGPAVAVEPTQASAVAMVVQELLSNSVKHGPLATMEGRVDVTWEIASQTSSTTVVDLRWREWSTTRQSEEPGSGEGLGLIDGLTRADLRGTVNRRFADDGMICSFHWEFDRKNREHPLETTAVEETSLAAQRA